MSTQKKKEYADNEAITENEEALLVLTPGQNFDQILTKWEEAFEQQFNERFEDLLARFKVSTKALAITRYLQVNEPEKVSSEESLENILGSLKEELSKDPEIIRPRYLPFGESPPTTKEFEINFTIYIGQEYGLKKTIVGTERKKGYWEEGDVMPTEKRIPLLKYLEKSLGLFIIHNREKIRRIRNIERGVDDIQNFEYHTVDINSDEIPFIQKEEITHAIKDVYRYPDEWRLSDGEVDLCKWEWQLLESAEYIEDYIAAIALRSFNELQKTSIPLERSDYITLGNIIDEFKTNSIRNSIRDKSINQSSKLESFVNSRAGATLSEKFPLYQLDYLADIHLYLSGYHNNDYRDYCFERIVQIKRDLAVLKNKIAQYEIFLSDSNSSSNENDPLTLFEYLEKNFNPRSISTMSLFLLQMEKDRMQNRAPLFHRRIKLRVWFLRLQNEHKENLSQRGEIVFAYAGGYRTPEEVHNLLGGSLTFIKEFIRGKPIKPIKHKDKKIEKKLKRDFTEKIRLSVQTLLRY